MSTAKLAYYGEMKVLITGASSGIGKATALYLAENGVAAICLFARRPERLDELAQELKETYPYVKTLVVAGDASNAADNKRAVDEAVAAFGGLTAAFINAGVYHGSMPLTETPDAVVEEIIDVNIKGVIYGLRYMIPAIKATVGETGQGSVVANSSCMGITAIAPKSIGSSVYAASKAAVNSLVETAAIENAPQVRINAVQPGVIQTGIMPVDHDTYQKFGASMQPLYGRPGQPMEVASLVAYLLSSEASFISGTLVKVDGLWSLSGGSFGL